MFLGTGDGNSLLQKIFYIRTFWTLEASIWCHIWKNMWVWFGKMLLAVIFNCCLTLRHVLIRAQPMYQHSYIYGR